MEIVEKLNTFLNEASKYLDGVYLHVIEDPFNRQSLSRWKQSVQKNLEVKDKSKNIEEIKKVFEKEGSKLADILKVFENQKFYYGSDLEIEFLQKDNKDVPSFEVNLISQVQYNPSYKDIETYTGGEEYPDYVDDMCFDEEKDLEKKLKMKFGSKLSKIIVSKDFVLDGNVSDSTPKYGVLVELEWTI